MSKFIANSFQLPNAFVDEMLCKLSGNACKIYLLIVRKTRGWHKEADKISYSQIQKSTGINHRATVSKAIDELLEIGLISVQKGDERSMSEYRLNDDFCGSKNEPDKKCTSSKNEPAGSKNEQEAGSKNEHTEIHYIKNTKEKYREYEHTHQNFQNPKNPISKKTQSVDNGILEKSKSKTTKPKITYEPPIDLKPTEKQITKCLENGLNANDEFDNFVNWALANGKGYANWSMGFNTWINNSIKFKSSKPQSKNREAEFAELKNAWGYGFYDRNEQQQIGLTHE
ncbi:replication protein [Moraxella sp. ZY200743]|uniref:replication protein n=1 Tax=Moraxella sp. ZY200743 TaxID=2911970 RepID=UPI003D7C810B